MVAGNQQKHLDFTFAIKTLSFLLLATLNKHQHTFFFFLLLKMFKLLKTVGRELFYNLKTLPSLAAAVSRIVKIRKMLYFQNERRYTDGNF